jgi:hypothetical protein
VLAHPAQLDHVSRIDTARSPISDLKVPGLRAIVFILEAENCADPSACQTRARRATLTSFAVACRCGHRSIHLSMSSGQDAARFQRDMGAFEGVA